MNLLLLPGFRKLWDWGIRIKRMFLEDKPMYDANELTIMEFIFGYDTIRYHEQNRRMLSGN